MRHAIFLAVAIGCSGDPAAQTPPRDRGTVEQLATAGVRGRIVAADTGLPLRDTPVTLVPLVGSRPHSTRTDANGVFEFALPPGEYGVRVAAGSAIARYLPVGDDAIPGSDTPTVRVAAHQVLEGIEIRLQRAGAISGVVVDDYGEPVALAQIGLVRKLSGGRQRPQAHQRPTMTDDLGRFRVFGLSPGRYFLSARPHVAGGASDAPESTRLLPTYYPSTTTAAESVPIELELGKDVSGLELRLVRGGIFTVHGTVVDSRGALSPDAIVTIMSRGADGGFFGRSAAVEPDGSFLVRNVAAGEYFLAVRPKLNARDAGPGAEFAVMPLSVHQDLYGIVLATEPWASVSGRVVLESTTPARLPPGLRVTVADAENRPAANLLPASAPVAADGTFTIHNVPDRALLRVNGARGWWLKSVALGGQDVTDRPTDFRNGEQRVQIVLTKEGGSISGRVSPHNGTIASDAVAVLFSAERERWSARATTTRTTPVKSDGSFVVPALRPGQYLLVALPSKELSLQDAGADYFEMLAGLATPVALAENEGKSVAVPLSRLPD